MLCAFNLQELLTHFDSAILVSTTRKNNIPEYTPLGREIESDNWQVQASFAGMLCWHAAGRGLVLTGNAVNLGGEPIPGRYICLTQFRLHRSVVNWRSSSRMHSHFTMSHPPSIQPQAPFCFNRCLLVDIRVRSLFSVGVEPL
jgi:hypothetical protein